MIIDLSYNLSKYILYKHIGKLFEVGCLHQHTVIALYCLDRNRKVLEFLRILRTTVYFKDRDWIYKTVYCISCLMVCKIYFCSEFLVIPDKAGRVTWRKRTQAIAKHFAFHANAKIMIKMKTGTTLTLESLDFIH